MNFSERKEVDKTFWALRLGIWMCVLIVGALVYLHFNPIVIENEPIPFKPFRISRTLKTDITIIIDYDAIKNSEELFSKKDWSAAWIDTFEQEIGPITIATPKTLTHEILMRSRILVLSASVASSVPDGIIEKIRTRVREGMIVVLERPKGKLRETFSADGKGELRKSSSISFGPSFGIEDEKLKKIPLFGSFQASLSARKKSESYIAFNGAPTIYSVPIGKGAALTIEFEYGKEIVALQQGLPNDDFSIKKRDTLRSEYLTSDLVADPSLLGESIPIADLLERTLVWKAIGALKPIAALWPFPKTSDGVLLFLHDDKSLGEDAFWLGELEKENDATGTFLFSSDAFSEQEQKFNRKGNEIGFLWKTKASNSLQERMGVMGWKPLTRPLGILAQHKYLLEATGIDHVTTSAILDSRWLERWDEPFRNLAAIGVRIDTSYEVEATSGYNFGTGFPFLALSRDGIPIGLREQPVVFPYGAIRGPALEKLLEDSQQNTHQAILMRLSTDAFSKNPDPTAFKEWTSIFNHSKKFNHKMMSVSSYDVFLRARRVAGMRSRFTTQEILPVLPKNPRDEKIKRDEVRADRFRVTVNAKRADHAIVVPETINGKSVFSVREKSKFVDGVPVSKELESDVVHVMGNTFRRVKIPRGFSTVDVFYQ